MKYTKLIHSFLEDSAEKYPDKNALFANNTWHTYQEINDTANQLAHHLIEAGLKKGERVAIFIENSFEYVVTYYAILKVGGITVALNTDNTSENIEYIAKDCDISLFITNQVQLRKVQQLFKKKEKSVWQNNGILVWSKLKEIKIPDSDIEFILLPETIKNSPIENINHSIIDLDIASIVYTSGSTGEPRGATLSHLNIVSNTRSIVEYLKLTTNDRIMVVLPFYYIYGKSLLNTHFFVGGSVVIDNRFMYPNVVLETMQEQEITGFSGVPSTFTILLHRSNLKAYKFEKLRYITQAGGAMAASVQKEVAKAFSPAKLYIMYGATEASARLSYLDPSDLPRKWGSIGKAIPNVELFVADNDGNKLEAGVEGEIVARGSNIMSAYWNHPEESEKVFKNGYYLSGDIGKMDEEGFIYVVGRSKDMLKIGGNRVSAKEIEEALIEHQNVTEAAVIGVDDDILGEAPKAFIVLMDKKNLDNGFIDELNNFLKSKIAVYKLPKFYEFIDALPKNESGKVLKKKLI